MRRAFVFYLFWAASSAASLYGQSATMPVNSDGSRWAAAWESAAGSSPFVPSELARETVLRELGIKPGESAESHARRAFAAALELERSLRFGYTLQESRARLRRTLRLESSVGAGNGERMAENLEKAERRNAKRGGVFAGAGKSSWKGKSGR